MNIEGCILSLRDRDYGKATFSEDEKREGKEVKARERKGQ
jgi:hypothetical protein